MNLLYFLVTKIVYIGYGQLKNDSFSFYLSIAVLVVFLYLIAIDASAKILVYIFNKKKLQTLEIQ
jgi:hypothetical protein